MRKGLLLVLFTLLVTLFTGQPINQDPVIGTVEAPPIYAPGFYTLTVENAEQLDFVVIRCEIRILNPERSIYDDLVFGIQVNWMEEPKPVDLEKLLEESKNRQKL